MGMLKIKGKKDTLVSDKEYSNQRQFLEPKRNIRVLHNDKRINAAGIHNNPKYVYIKQHSLKIHEAENDRTERRNKLICNYN